MDLNTEIVHADLRRLIAIWEEAREGALLPSATFIRAERLFFLLGRLSVVDVLRPGPRFFLRLVGTDIEHAFGTTLQGRYLDHFAPSDHWSDLRNDFENVVESGVPRHRVLALRKGHSAAAYERLILPFSNATSPQSEDVSVLLVANAWPAHDAANIRYCLGATPT